MYQANAFCHNYYCNGKPEQGAGGGAFTNFCDLKKKLFFFKSETFCRLRSSPNDLRFGLSLKEFWRYYDEN